MELTVPGDKSISQRALILAALASGTSRLRGLLTGDDPLATARILRTLGADISDLRAGSTVEVVGRGLRGLTLDGDHLDCANSGTCARLMLGVLAGQSGGSATVTGDRSLRARPMARVTDPLARMGARFVPLEAPGRLPLRVEARDLRSGTHEGSVASAQVKSAVLLAGLVSGNPVTVVEPYRSRDHTERMFATLGVRVREDPVERGWRVRLDDPPGSVEPLDLDVPGDFSSAAFFIVLALLGGAGDGLTIRGCGLNPTRTRLFDVLERMGARVERTGVRNAAGDPHGDVVAVPSSLTGVTIGGDAVPGLIDEIPILAVAAARAEGTTRITGAGELRVKESDRIRAIVDNLRRVGVDAEELDDGVEIVGSDGPLSGEVRAFGDHRIAMAFGILGALSGHAIQVDEPDVADVSFPGFWTLLAHAAGG